MTLPPTTLDRIKREAEEKYPTTGFFAESMIALGKQQACIAGATAEATRAEKLIQAQADFIAWMETSPFTANNGDIELTIMQAEQHRANVKQALEEYRK